MGLCNEQKQEITKLLEKKITDKLKKYVRESSSMPFLVKLIQDREKVASYSFIHSMATTLGMSIYEEVSVIITRANSQESFKQYDVGGVISKEQKSVITEIVDELRNKQRKTNINKEINEVLKADSAKGKSIKDGRIADFYMKRNGIEYYFEIKTAKPNIDVFSKTKVKLLEWVARKRKKIKVILAIPYNPYLPEKYERFTVQGLFSIGDDLLVAEEYWDFLGGENTYKDLLKLFDKVGKKYKLDISKKIKEVAKIK